jgi:hypothetical protein
MIAKAVVTALSFQETEFPKAAAGEPPNETFTYYDEHTERDPRAVTIPIDRGIPTDQRPGKFEGCTMVLQVEEVERVVTRQDREDASRTYNSATKQHKVKVLAFEPFPKSNGRASAEPVASAAKS